MSSLISYQEDDHDGDGDGLLLLSQRVSSLFRGNKNILSPPIKSPFCNDKK